MSIIERNNPLNLAYKVIVVTNASSPVGVVVSNTLLKANALVLGTDSNEKDHSLSASTYSHFQFHKCKLTDPSAAENIIADAKHKFKADHIDGLINLMDGNEGSDTLSAHETLATACAKAIEPALDGGSIVNTLIQVPSGQDASADHLIKMTKGVSKETSDKIRCNAIVPGKGEQSCEEYDKAKDNFKFLFKRLDEQHKGKHEEAGAEKQAVFDFSNTVLFLASDASQGLDGVVMDGQGRVVDS